MFVVLTYTSEFIVYFVRALRYDLSKIDCYGFFSHLTNSRHTTVNFCCVGKMRAPVREGQVTAVIDLHKSFYLLLHNAAP